MNATPRIRPQWRICDGCGRDTLTQRRGVVLCKECETGSPREKMWQRLEREQRKGKR